MAKTSRAGHGSLNVRTGLDSAAIATALVENLKCLHGRPPKYATRNDWYMALAATVRDRMVDRYMKSLERIRHADHGLKVFLTGPHLGNNLVCLGIWDATSSYVDCQGRVSDAFGDQPAWARMSILNSARVGRFSSDRSIRDSCRDIWAVRALTPAELGQ